MFPGVVPEVEEERDPPELRGGMSASLISPAKDAIALEQRYVVKVLGLGLLGAAIAVAMPSFSPS